MPGKKDPEYFPLNFNMELYDYDYEEDDYESEGGSYAVSLPPHGKYDSDGNTTRRTRNVSFNEMFVPPENSEVEEDEETASVQSSDIDVDDDVVDTLVLSIREKLRMGPKFSVSSSHSSVASFWNETQSSSPYDSNNSGCSSSHSHSTKRFRVHPYFSSSTWKAARPNMGTFQNSNGSKTHCHHWWTTRSFSDIAHQRRGKSNPDSPNVDNPYQLLKELVDSGSLIKEAVRRIKTKRLGFMNRNNPSTSSSSNSNHNNILSPGSSTVRRFTYRDEDAENSYPTLPLSAQ